MNIRTLKRIKFVLGKFYRDKICFLSFKIPKYFKQYFSFIVDIYIYIHTMYHDHIHPNSSFLLPRDTCQHIPMSSFFSYYFYNHWVQAQSHACNVTSLSSQCSGLSCPDRSISLVTFFEDPPLRCFLSPGWALSSHLTSALH